MFILGGREREQLINRVSEPVFAVVCLTTICTRCAGLFVGLCCVGFFFLPNLSAVLKQSVETLIHFEITWTGMMMITHRI